MKMWGRFTFVSCLFFSLLFAQDLRLYFSLIQEGRVAEVRQALPDLARSYPKNPAVLYLQGLTVADGDSSVKLYRKLIRTYPKSEYCDDAAMKIGEYLYSRGLYTQASRQFSRIPLHYSQSPHHQRAMALMVMSYRATGELDSAAYNLARFKRKYPELDYDYGIAGLDEVEIPATTVEVVKIDPAQAQEMLQQQAPAVPVPAPAVEPTLPKPWVVQVGAFSNYQNARSLKNRLVANGYEVEISEVSSNNNRLHVVRVVRYPSKTDANAVGAELRRKFGLSYMVLNRPE